MVSFRAKCSSRQQRLILQAVLCAEGIKIDESGMADSEQRLTARDLEGVLGVGELPPLAERSTETSHATLRQRFQ